MVAAAFFFFFSSRRRHTRWNCDWSSDVCSSDLRHLERLAFDRLLDQPGPDGAHGDADRLDRAVDLDLDALEVREEPPLGRAGDLPADAAEVLGLAAVALLVTADGLLARNCTLLAHDA